MLVWWLAYGAAVWTVWLISAFDSLLIEAIDELRDKEYIEMASFSYEISGIIGQTDQFEE